MRYSFIIPVYNVAPYLRECLDSVLAQTCPDWEAICVNDGSTDDSLAILQEYAAKEKRIHVINQPNEGLSSARNNALFETHGEYIFFLDSDDWIVPDTLERLNKHIDGQDMICFAGQKYIEAENSYHKPDMFQPVSYSSGMDYYNANALQPRDFPFVCVVLRLYRRQYLFDNRLFFTEGIYHEDNLFAPLACYYATKVTVIPDCLYIYRVRSGSIMTTNIHERIKDMTKISNSLAIFFQSLQGFDKTTVYRAITHSYQAVLSHSPELVLEYVLPVLDWDLYYAVSRTKLRHRFNYLKFRLKYKYVRS